MEELPIVKFGSMAGNSKNDATTSISSTSMEEAQEMQIELESPQAMPQEERYRQLQHLLNRSKFYTKYLSEKINMAEIKKESSNNVNDFANGDVQRKSPRSGKKKEPAPKKRKLNDSKAEKVIASVATGNQPSLLTGATLRPYQLEGFNWLRVLYENGVNGILGDEMGLGKTIQCIAVIAHVIEMGVPGPFLICAPLSTLSNWESEFNRFTPSIPTLLYHGSIAERTVKRKQIGRLHDVGAQGCHPVVLTSYDIIMKDMVHFMPFTWEYIVVDEGQRIKNYECLLVKCLKSLESRNRLLLTGTPLQNNLTELWSLLNFVLPEIFDNLKIFHSWFDMSKISSEASDEYIIIQEQEKHLLETLHEILTPFLLRRLKADVELCIPPKREMLVFAPFTKKQSEFYKGTVDRTIRDLMPGGRKKAIENPVASLPGNGRPKRRVTMKNALGEYSSPQSHFKQAEPEESEVNLRLGTIMMTLRKCCNHPYLIEYPLEAATGEYLVDENLVQCSGKMIVLDVLLKELKERGHKVLIFSQMTNMLDILRDFCYLRGYDYCLLDGRMGLTKRQEQIKEFNENSESFIFLVSTRAGGLGINLTAADTAIIYDSDWNPQCDLQAMDRCHRIGQTKPVIVLRLITENTIDQRMVERAAAKRKLEKIVIHKDKFKKGGVGSGPRSLGCDMKELLAMLKSTDHDGVVHSGSGEIFTAEELEMLLDRQFSLKRDIASIPAMTNRVMILEADDASGGNGESNRVLLPDK